MCHILGGLLDRIDSLLRRPIGALGCKPSGTGVAVLVGDPPMQLRTLNSLIPLPMPMCVAKNLPKSNKNHGIKNQKENLPNVLESEVRTT